ncbi:MULTISPECIES: hypothetical protein [unclassified Roseateles]|uniref:hypothetical protein n=1 Tax=unclassified Roseateles TaxID=2626991 RepID=UPI0006FE50DE|nr:MULTISPECIES: hypothetical protein [unclassified Roseateles]KQW45383.1 hypothetical protein ASC81_10705 [Pelomonas sp. Root405]KRA72227.1 hypothetical protein ASD88_10705 [Pelomonas sp. Root662]
MRTLLRAALLVVTSLITACRAGEARIPDGGARIGGLVIEALQRSGRNFDANQGFTTTDYVEFRVLHGGRAIAVEGDFGKRSPDVRDAWVLVGASRPAVLMGSSGWTLVAEHEGRLEVTPLTPHGSGTTVQWMDWPEGLGPAHHSRLRTDAKDPRRLEGGRRLLIGDQVVLDVDTLQWRRLDLRVPPGYKDSGVAPTLWPAAGGALVRLYAGEANSPHDALLVVSDPATGGSRTLAFDLGTTGRPGFASPDAAWLDEHFELVTGPDGERALSQRAGRTPPAPWQFRYQFGAAAPVGPEGPVQRLTLAPVLPSMLQAALALSHAELKTKDMPLRTGDPAGPGFARVSMWLAPMVFRFDAATQALVIVSEDGSSPLDALAAVREVGSLLADRLNDGSLRAHLADHRR